MDFFLSKLIPIFFLLFLFFFWLISTLFIWAESVIRTNFAIGDLDFDRKNHIAHWEEQQKRKQFVFLASVFVCVNSKHVQFLEGIHTISSGSALTSLIHRSLVVSRSPNYTDSWIVEGFFFHRSYYRHPYFTFFEAQNKSNNNQTKMLTNKLPEEVDTLLAKGQIPIIDLAHCGEYHVYNETNSVIWIRGWWD